ncbi:MAG: tRNA (adenosine(37)-N6)-dimethylallyltransferase MiaA [Candidatus Peregrinibacteria bacterium]
MKPLIVILGPTASGKTDLSLKIAKLLNSEIISVDSRQIYKEMNIATDALPKSKQKGITHHLLNITKPDKPLTLAEFKQKALKIISKLHKQNKVPILVGGTGLYISAIVEDYDIPKVPPNPKLRAKLEKHTTKYLYAKLKKLDPESANSIHPNNKRYLIRAIEKSDVGGYHVKNKTCQFDPLLIGIKTPRETLYSQVNARVDHQLKNGLIKEVKKLLTKYDLNLPAMSSLGVKEIIPYLNKQQTLPEATEILKRNTRRYAKRQMTWFRRYDSVHWLTPQEIKDNEWRKLLKHLKISKT